MGVLDRNRNRRYMDEIGLGLLGVAVAILLIYAAVYLGNRWQTDAMVRFDLYQVPMPVPSEPRFVGVLDLNLDDPDEYLGAGHPEQPSLFLLIPCGEEVDGNPCGPEGRSPDRFGGIVEDVIREDRDES